jgi:signal transduction histidine kinase/ligand-binding sensor domain-containing protein
MELCEQARRNLPQRFLQRFAAAVAGLALTLSLPAIAWPLDPATALQNYGRQTWVMENGLPQNTVTAIVQSHEGFIWLGTEAGLVRFDGNSFQLFDRNSTPALPDNDICCLLGAKDGAMWIGTSGGLARWHNGQMRSYSTRDGLPDNNVRALSLDAKGDLLVTTETGEIVIASGKVVPVGLEMLQSPSQSQNPIFFAQLTDRSNTQATASTVKLILRGKDVTLRVGRELPGTRIQALMADREDALWIGTNGGLARWYAGSVERLPVTDPLATASVLALMEDREGNLWAGTETGGLHILRDQRFRVFGERDGLNSEAITAVTEDRTGTLWVGTQNAGLNALAHEVDLQNLTKNPPARTWTTRNGLMSDLILSLAAAANGDVWVGTPDGLNRISGNKPLGKVDAFTSADGLPDDFIRSLLADSDGSLWIGTRRGLAHWMNASLHGEKPQFEILTQANGLASDTVGAMARDAGGDLWIATFGGLSRLHGGRISNYTTANGLSSNVLTALLPLRNGSLLVGTQDHGWDRWDGQKFAPAAGADLSQAAIHAILDDTQGHIWLATDAGIARCALSSASVTDKDEIDSRCIEFGTADGLHSRETAANSHPSAIRSRDGRLWFATPKGLVEADPAHFPINTVEPSVALERFAVDDVDQPLHSQESLLKIATGHVHFQFDYAGLSFTAPLKVRYRYRLEGFDRNWTDAGTRRAAYYTNVPPGKYTFHVQAANNDGLWNTAGAEFSFELKPHFYQTAWFYALLILLIASSVLLILRIRLRTAQHEFRVILGERSRIAREIHDTLAQGYAGISIQLEMLAQLLRQNRVDAAAEQLNKTREYVREGLADARQSIWALRTQDADESTLPVKMRRLVEAAGDAMLAAEFSVFGAYRPLDAAIERELLRIAQEAIHNVKKHSGAGNLAVQLKYDAAAIELEISDNGKGGAPGDGEAALQGGFGMTGMRERAAAIHGTLQVMSVPGQGTTVRLRVPAQAVHSQTGDRA